MKRVQARTLVLVNWKGVFYERYILDDHVTALEGNNGAGKTTVMIAAYVVMLPDMTRLRFTNVGESDATGGDKGVWGRLGDPNRPSYAALMFDVGGQRVLAGVHLERKGEPSIELTPFMVSDLPEDVRLQDVLLLKSSDEDFVPELTDLQDSVTRLGAQMRIFRKAKDYFAALFECGITPLRLAADDERTRFNDMLRTSMTGGISRALTSEFRSFLLKEESGLADTLVRMRGNLDACRRTRTEVKEAQELEREISGVYEAGHAMFAAALLATRERAEELRRRVEEAQHKRETAQRQHDAVAHELSERAEERSRVQEKLTKSRADYDVARRLLEQVTAANVIAKRIAAFHSELQEVGSELETAASDVGRADNLRARRADERRRAEEAYRRSADGLADLQRGLDELHRRADAFRTVLRRLAEARAALARPDLATADVESQEETTEASIAVIDRKRNELDTAISGAEAHRTDHAEAMRALTSILEREVDPRDAHEQARTALRHLSELEAPAERVEVLDEELQRARVAQERQRAARAAATGLSRPGEPLISSHEVSEALRRADLETRATEEVARGESSKADACRRARQDLQDKQRELQMRAVRWRELDTVASRLEGVLGAGLRTPQELEAARQLLDGERDELQQRIEALQATRAEAKDRARTLEETGGAFHRDLLAARDIVGGELLATHLDDVEPAQAGHIQARLGPLAEAIVVEDAVGAAAGLAGRDREVDSIWLVEDGGLHDLIGSDGGVHQVKSGATDVVVRQNGIVRTTRVPSRPTVGRKARQCLIADLLAQAEELAGRIGELETRLGEISSRRRDTALLTREIATLGPGDPAFELASVSAELEEQGRQVEAHLEAANEAQSHAARLSKRVDELRDLLANAFLLDEPDFTERVSELKNAWRAAGRARTELARVSAVRRTLGDRIDALRRLPLSESALAAMRAELAELGGRRAQLFLALDALRYVAANRDAFAWSDAQESLSVKQELVPALKAQCEKAAVEQQAAIEAAQTAEQAWESARGAWRAIDDRRSALEASRQQAQRELTDTGVEDPSDRAVERSCSSAETLALVVEDLDRAERVLDRTTAQLNERLSARKKELGEAEEHLAREEREWKPAQELWERLRARAEKNGLLTPAISARLFDIGTGSVNLRSEARSWGKALHERLGSAKGGQEILERVHSWLSGQEQTTGDDYLQAWEVVRDWLRRRVPAQVAEVDDPLEALERLRHHLRMLGDRLEAQEVALRGASEDVARGIDVHIRAAQRQVRLLNRELEGVRFGTIRSMQIRLSRDDRMEAVLSALREGSAQELLFAPTIPVEEALGALFTRYGGRGPTVGQKLLDYREYVDIAVEVQRQASSDWERVNPSRLSTGEAIGVGTALMMVVLTAWERAANLFRARRSLGTLRLLFLDEANRLSQDNLEVLFELCTGLRLQLLIAAPEVARAPGCTTYRLVRRETADGAEEVVVSGRRNSRRGLNDVGA